MTQSEPSAAQNKKPRWLREEISRSVTVRNLAIAAIIALGVIALLLIVGLAPRLSRRPTALPLPDSPASSPAVIAGAAEYSLAGDKLIPATPEIWDKIDQYLIDHGVYDGFNLEDIEAATGYSIGNVAKVESGEGWSHSVVIGPKRQIYHIYQFRYTCGHYADTCADPNRDLMYADPQSVADRYATMLCRECKSLKEHLDRQDQAPAQDGPSGEQGA